MKNQTSSVSRQWHDLDLAAVKFEFLGFSMDSCMQFIQKSRLFMLALGMTLALASCEDEQSTTRPVDNTPEPTGNILVKVTTVGGDDDPDGYTLTVQGVSPVQVEPNGEIPVNSKQVGRYQVELSGIASHCSATGNLVREVNVTANGTATVEFEVSCKAILRDRIVYSKGLDNFTEFKIYSSKLDGTDERLILDQVGPVPSSVRISPDGTKISYSEAVTGTNVLRVYVMDADGENIKMIPFLPSDTPALTSQFNAVWHPDGKKLTFRNAAKTVTYDLEKDERTELEFGPGELFFVNDVFDNGNKFLGVYIIIKPGEPSSQALATVNADGTNFQLLQEGATFISPIKGKDNTVVYLKRVSNRNDEDEVWQINLDGTGDQKISDKMGLGQGDVLRSFTLSPDNSEFIMYLARGSNILLAKTGVNSIVQPIVFPSAGLRIFPLWSPITRD